MPKRQFREEFLKKRRDIPKSERESRSLLIQENAKDFIPWDQIKKIGLYANQASEVETVLLFKSAREMHKLIAFPRVTNEEEIQYCIIDELSDLIPGSFGINEPLNSNRPISIESLDLIVVPGLAFDKYGYRLGYGRGYFDRILKSVDIKKVIGLAFENQIVEQLPVQSHDIRVGTIITESGVIECNV